MRVRRQGGVPVAVGRLGARSPYLDPPVAQGVLQGHGGVPEEAARLGQQGAHGRVDHVLDGVTSNKFQLQQA